MEKVTKVNAETVPLIARVRHPSIFKRLCTAYVSTTQVQNNLKDTVLRA